MQNMTCPNCGALLQAQANERKYICMYCDSAFSIESGERINSNSLPDKDFEEESLAEQWFDVQVKHLDSKATTAWETMCGCINGGDDRESFFEAMNQLAKKTNDIATSSVNSSMLRSTEMQVSSKFQAGEHSLMFWNCSVFSKGKDGFLITNKAIYRLKKKTTRQLLYEKIYSITAEKGVLGDGAWRINDDWDFRLYAFAVNDIGVGIILGFICSLIRENHGSDYKIRIYGE